MHVRRLGGISVLAVGAVLLSGSLGSGTGLAAAPEPSASESSAAGPGRATALAPTLGGTALPTVALAPTVAEPATAVFGIRPELIAHRGDHSGAVPNTPPAIALAMANGADAVEFDVVATADNVPVVMHDANLARNTVNCTGSAAKKTYRQIRQCRTKNGAKVPNLAEMLDEIPAGNRVYLHLKTPAGRGLAPRLMDAVNAYGLNRDARAVFFSSHTEVLEELREQGATSLGLIFNDSAASWGWDADYQVLIPYQTPVTAKLVRAAQERGQFVVPVQARPTTVAQARRLGVDGFIVDDLEGARAVLG